MRREVSWKFVGPVLAAVLAVIVIIVVRSGMDSTVSEKEIKAPKPPGGFPSAGKSGVPE
ncbi:hypothetical protein [Fimbriimonas ginsengisoli]|uniref:Uncharacterized protein n=1 Tax=Fimbriimonas ginsengisoli Gsoil 348 TaxID=661478 RepID=A0A068NPA6_FIMGI|nr:hypothetical protein [Fimbriimonas ginsengisoli]AIE85286.1 hypothetical protein OP10G_1918 [Fimbriimonas ginsengisoli Gsoil 348]